jgi:hypothetical protein
MFYPDLDKITVYSGDAVSSRMSWSGLMMMIEGNRRCGLYSQ